MSENISDGVLTFFVRMQDQFSAPLTEAQERIERFKSALADIGVGLTEAFSGYKVIEKIIDPAVQMQQLMNQIQIATHASNDEIERAKDVAMEYSTVFGISAESILGGLMQLEKYTGSLGTAMAALPSAIELAAGAHIDLAQAITMVGAAYNDLNDPSKTAAENAKQIADWQTVLLTLYPKSAAGMQQATRDQARAAAAAKAYHISYAQILATLALVNKTGLAGQRGGGTIVDQLIDTLFKLDKHGVPALEQYHLKIAKTADGNIDLVKTLELIKAAGPAALDAVAQSVGITGQNLALFMGLVDQLPATVAAFHDSAGAASAAAAKSTGTFQTQMANFQNAMNNLRDSLSLELLPAVTQIVQEMTALMVIFNKFAMEHPTFTRIFGWTVLGFAALMMLNGVIMMTTGALDLLVAAGGLLTYLPKVFTLMKTALTGVPALLDAVAVAMDAATLPVILMGLEIIALVALVAIVVYLLIEKWKYFKLGMETVFNWIWDRWKELWHRVETFFTPLVEAMKSTWQGFMDFLKGVEAVIDPIVAAFERAYAAVAGIAAAIGKVTGVSAALSMPGAPGGAAKNRYGLNLGPPSATASSASNSSTSISAPATTSTQVTVHAPLTVTVQGVGSGGEQVAGQVEAASRRHLSNLTDELRHVQEHQGRLDFSDSRWATP